MTNFKRDYFAQAMGFITFALGLAVIIEVLIIAMQMFNDKNLGFHTTNPKGPSAADIAIGFGVLVLRIALLFLGSISGSIIANKGVQLYFSGGASKQQSGAPASSRRQDKDSETTSQETKTNMI